MKKQIIIKTLIITGIISLLTVPVLSYAENINIQADKQTFDGKTTNFEGKVSVDYQNINVKSPKVVVKSDANGKTETATFLNGAHAVKTDGSTQSEIKANIINLSLLKNRIKAEGNAESAVFENKKPIVHISAATQEFDIAKNIIVATDNVKIDYQEIKTKSNKARISIDADGNLKKVELIGKAIVNQDKSVINADDVLYNAVTNEMVAYGNVNSTTILDDGTPVDIVSEFQQYDKGTQTLITSGHVKINYKGYVAVGPKAIFIPDANSAKTGNSGKPNKIVFIGRSKIIEGERHVEADKIEITVNPKNFTAEGNVKTRFTQVQSIKDMKKQKS
ncbi:MAG: LptA/OstA family protein [bacterium]